MERNIQFFFIYTIIVKKIVSVIYLFNRNWKEFDSEDAEHEKLFNESETMFGNERRKQYLSS